MDYGSDKWDELWLGTIAFGIVLLIAYFALTYFYTSTKKQTHKRIATVCMAALIAFEGGYNCYDSFRKIYKEVGNSDKKSYTEIISAPDVVQQLKDYDDGFYRAEKTYSRMVNDNLAYGLKGISHSSSVMNARAIKFIEAMGYFTQSFESKYEGCNPISDSLLGIKYVLDDPTRNSSSSNMLDSSYQKVFSTTYTRDNDVTSNVDVYENPNALSIGYMADDDITILTGLGNDNPFNSLNNFLSSMTGNTADYSTVPIVPKQYYVPFDYQVSYDESKVYLHDYTNTTGTVHDCYEAFAGVDDAVVNVHVTVPKDGDIYMHLGSEMRRACNVWVSSEKDENGEFINHKGYGTYFNTNSSPIVRMGPFEAGTEVEIRFTIQPSNGSTYTGSNEYLMVRKESGFNFYYLDEEAFTEDINKLKQNEWVLDTEKSNDRYLVGDVDAQEGQILMTSIPYEPGWKVQVDGKTVDSLVVNQKNADGTTTLSNADGDTGEIILLNALIGIKLPAGHHTVSMKYTPPGFNAGVFTLILGIAVICHGALCMAVSGKCYLSLHEMNASANRGACMQICRRSYEVKDKETGNELEVDNAYIMSPKDLKTIHFLNKLIDSGLRVFKIEGRARGPEYVRTVVSCYNEAIESYLNDDFTDEKIALWDERLATVFNRGFWNGYYLGQRLGEWTHNYGSGATKRKIYIGKGVKYFSNLGVAEFLMESGSLSVGDEILVTGPTTGALIRKVEEIRVDLKPVQKTVKGERFSMRIDEKIRPSDKLFKWVDSSELNTK